MRMWILISSTNVVRNLEGWNRRCSSLYLETESGI